MQENGKGSKMSKNKRHTSGEITFPNGKKYSINIKNPDEMSEMEYQAEMNRQIFTITAGEEGPYSVRLILYLQAVCIKEASGSFTLDEEEAALVTSLPLKHVVVLEQDMDMETGKAHNVFAKFYKNNPALCVSVLDTPTGSNYESVDDMSISDNRKSTEEARDKMRENLQTLFEEKLPPVEKMGRWIDDEFWLEEEGVMCKFTGFKDTGW